jgi:hypothetical protein
MRPERRTLEGRPHLVVPMVMLVPGVATGSQGPLLYEAADLKHSVPLWNGRPIVVYHPDMKYSSAAGHPEVFDAQRIGTVFGARFERGALRADAWIDEGRCALVDNRVLAAVLQGEMMELSTGLFTDNESRRGEHMGRAYDAVARNHRPDHLAVLPDMRGACSIEDGAGLCRNELRELLLMPVMNFSAEGV